jgi:NitT/TauT family transport system substrate-binding protein
MRQVLLKSVTTSVAASVAACTFTAALALAAATVSAAETPVTFQLNWMAGGPNAGFAAAVAEGYYKEVAST